MQSICDSVSYTPTPVGAEKKTDLTEGFTKAADTT